MVDCIDCYIFLLLFLLILRSNEVVIDETEKVTIELGKPLESEVECVSDLAT